MNAQTLPADTAGYEGGPGSSGWRALLALRFERREHRSTLTHVRHEGPLTVQRPLYPEGQGVCHAIVVHPPGGVAGGDALRIDVRAGPGAHGLLTTPGAGKFYKSAGRVAAQAVQLRVEHHAVIEWLPQETIVFDGADARLALDLDLEPGARAIAWEIVMLGRIASGETFCSGRLRQRLALHRAGERVLDETSDVRGGSGWLAAAPGWNGLPVAGTLVAAGATASDALVESCRRALEPFGTRAAITRLAPDVLVGRYLGATAGEARIAFATLWTALRPGFTGEPARAPRIWST